MNITVLSGRLAKDPELRYTPEGVAVCTFTLAVNRRYTEQDGTRKADFIPIVVWRKLAESCANNLKKGRAVIVEGSIRVRNYDKDGERRYVTEIIADNIEFGNKPKGDSESGQV